MKLKVREIVAGSRYRHDMGDIAGLAASIADVGLLQPIVVTPTGTLVAGERRLAAVRSLGLEDIDVHVVDNLDDASALLRAERDENTCRKPFTPTEEHALYEALLALEKPNHPTGRPAADSKPQKVSGVSGSDSPAKRAAAEAATGKPGRYKSLDKVGEVKAIATDETKPEPVRKLAEDALADMDASGRVDGAYQRVKDAERVAAAPKPDPAVSAFLDNSQAVKDAGYVKAFMSALVRADGVLIFDAERLATLLDADEVEAVSRHVASLTRFSDTLRRQRRGLQVIAGGGGRS
jgi:ParB family chromosome partitioning protein